MPTLKCHEFTCKSNHCTHCSKESLNISKDALCKDYRLRGENESEDVGFEFSYEKGMSLKVDEHRIMCSDTRCINNVSGECGAAYIRIDRKNGGAYCCQARDK